MIRLHVIAASDSDADQALKLQVRDAVLAQATDWLAGTTDRDEAEDIAQDVFIQVFESLGKFRFESKLST